MTETIALKTAVDVYVTPTQKAIFGTQRMYVNATAQAYLFFSLPALPATSQIVAATLRAWEGNISADAVGPNLVTNPDFEVNTTGWSVAGAGATMTRDTAIFDTGVASVRLNSTVIDSSIFTNVSIPAIGSKQYTASIRVRGTGSALIIIEKIASGFATVATSSTLTLTGAFQTITVSGTTDASTTSLRIHVRQRTTAAQTLYVDNVTVQDAFPTVTAHLVTSAYDSNNLTWTTKPTESAAVETENGSSGADAFGRKYWDFDLTPELNTMLSTPDNWYGVTLKGNGTETQYFNSSMSKQPMSLIIQWTAAPGAPTALMPNSAQKVNLAKPVLTWNYQSAGGTERPFSLNVQTATNVNMVTGLWDSGEVLSGSAQLDLATTAFVAVPSGQTRYWRVRTKNTSGLWSAWSVVQSWTFVTSGVVAITGPAVSMSSPDPDITWTFTGATQQAYQVLITGYGQLVHDSGIKYGTALLYDVPQGIWDYNNDVYTVEVRVWDTQDIVGVPGVSSYAYATRAVTYIAGATPAPVEIRVSNLVGYPHQWVEWRYTGPTPDKFQIIRYRYPGDTTPVVTWKTPAETTQAPAFPTWYGFYDAFVNGRNDSTWVVRAVKSNITSGSEPSVTKSIDHKYPWVCSINDITKRFFLINADIDPGLSEISSIVQPISGVPYLATQSLQGYVGTASGQMVDGIVSGLSSQKMKDNFLWLRKNPSVYILWADEAIQGYLYQTKIVPIPTADGGTDYAVAFAFIETGGVIR